MNKKQLYRIKAVFVKKYKINRWLALKLGKTEATISRWCTNNVQPSVEVFNQSTKFLDVGIQELFVSTN